MRYKLAGEPADELVAAAKAHGFNVSRPQMARWHRADLLPRPATPSRGRGLGRQSIYPPGTTEQLLTLCRIHERERRLGHVAWELWWQGYDTPIRHVRAMLARHAAEWERIVESLRTLGGGLSKAACTFINAADVARLPSGGVRKARKRLGTATFPTFVRLLLEAVTGSFEAFAPLVRCDDPDDERKVVEGGLRVARARSEGLAGGEPWLRGELEDALQDLSRMLRDFSPHRELDQAADEELARARDDLRILLGCIVSLPQVLEQVLGRDALGLGGFAAAIRHMHPMTRALLLLFWLRLHRAGYTAKIETLVSAAQFWLQVGAPAIRQLQDLREAVPATAEALSSKQIAAALQRPDVLAEWFESLRLLGEENREEVTAFLARQAEPQWGSADG